MGNLEIAWGVSIVVAGWFLPIGMIRMIAYRSGQVDHTRGMGRLAAVTLGTGVLAALVAVALTVAVATSSR